MDLGVLFLFMFLMKLAWEIPVEPKSSRSKESRSFMCQPCVTTSIMLLAVAFGVLDAR